jgi:mannose-1-phosphate guanylyltransferase
MQAVILAGGLGTRLRAVSGDTPKPMVAVQHKPFLEYPIGLLQAFGIHDIVLCVGYHADAVRAYFGDGARWHLNLTYAAEPEPRGTAGALKFAENFLDETFLVLNGDTYARVDYTALVRFHWAQRAEVTLAVTRRENARAAGSVILENERVVAFREKDASASGAVWVNAGAYVMQRDVLQYIPPAQNVSLERDTFPALLARGARVSAFPFDDYFIDVGTPETYRQFGLDLVTRGWNDVPQ